MTKRELKRALEELLVNRETIYPTLSLLCELAPLGHPTLRAVSRELIHKPKTRGPFVLSRFALMALQHAGAPRAKAPTPRALPMSLKEALSLTDQLEGLLRDIALTLPLRHDLSAPERLRWRLTTEAAIAFTSAARAQRGKTEAQRRTLATLAAASARLGELVLTAPTRWRDDGVGVVLEELAALEQGGAGGARWLTRLPLSLEDVIASARWPAWRRLLRRSVAGCPLLPHAALWRELLAEQHRGEVLEDLCFIAARATVGRRRWIRGAPLALVYCPPGSLEIGAFSVEGEEGVDPVNNKDPLSELQERDLLAFWRRTQRIRSVTLTSGFWMGQALITCNLWRSVMSTSLLPNEDTDVYPHEWIQGVLFCNALSAHEGLEPAYEVNRERVSLRREASGYRLPTEAEWQHAARSSSELLGSKEALEALQQEWLCARPRGERGKGEVSNWGLYDMTGEFSEWSTDAWRQVYQLGAPEPLLDPVEDDPDAGFHTLRGELPRDQYIRRSNYINYRVPGRNYLHPIRDWSLKYDAYFRVVRGTRGLNAPWPSGASEAPELA